MNLPDFLTSTFASVKAAFLNQLGLKPADCPCCGQMAKVYRRSIHRKMCVALAFLYREDQKKPGDWVNVREIYGPGLSGDYAKLRFWGLVEPKDTRTRTENSSGFWRITEKGRAFVRTGVAIPKYAFVFDNVCRNVDGPLVTFFECAGKKFDYDQIMNK